MAVALSWYLVRPGEHVRHPLADKSLPKPRYLNDQAHVIREHHSVLRVEESERVLIPAYHVYTPDGLCLLPR